MEGREGGGCRGWRKDKGCWKMTDRDGQIDRQTDGQTQRIILPSNMLEDDRQTGRHKESFFLLICWKMTDRQTGRDRQADRQTQRIILPSNHRQQQTQKREKKKEKRERGKKHREKKTEGKKQPETILFCP